MVSKTYSVLCIALRVCVRSRLVASLSTLENTLVGFLDKYQRSSGLTETQSTVEGSSLEVPRHDCRNSRQSPVTLSSPDEVQVEYSRAQKFLPSKRVSECTSVYVRSTNNQRCSYHKCCHPFRSDSTAQHRPNESSVSLVKCFVLSAYTYHAVDARGGGVQTTGTFLSKLEALCLDGFIASGQACALEHGAVRLAVGEIGILCVVSRCVVEVRSFS